MLRGPRTKQLTRPTARRVGVRAAVVALVIVLCAGCASLLHDKLNPNPMSSPVPVAPGTGVASQRQLFGVFLGSDQTGIDRMPQFEEFLGGRRLEVGHTYLPGATFQDIAGSPQLLQPWAQWKAENPDALFVLNVPMAAPNEADEQSARQGGQALTDDQVANLLAAGANGQFDQTYRTLGQRLVQLGLADSVIVPGWEMNGTTYSHRCAPNPEAWQQFFRRVVGAMRSVPGQRFVFDFNPSRGEDAIPWTQCYPGDDVVDIIGMDSYDQPMGASFDDFVTEDYGLQDHVDFAAQRGKPISFPEWGLFRNGDNPEYMRRMSEWIQTHDTVYSTYTNYCPHAVLAVGPESSSCSNPQSAEVLRQYFGN
ncbi:MAG: glycoside hydrolase family 26 protein [Pseudonocardia sp.]